MKIKDVLGAVRGRLDSAGIEEAGLEAELLLRHALCLGSVGLFLEHDEELGPSQVKLISLLVDRRVSGEPVAYITGKREFYGREFHVNPHVLIPRPETEHLVEKALEIVSLIKYPVVADIGTGSGAIAVSLAADVQGARMFAVDISDPAIDTARLNARRQGVDFEIVPLPDPWISTQGVGATSEGLFYRQDEDSLYLKVPQPIQKVFTVPSVQQAAYETLFMGCIGCVQFIRPTTALYMYGW